MFAPYCPGHRSRILIALEEIDELVRIPQGFNLRFQCHCGYQGWHRQNKWDDAHRRTERNSR